MISVGRRFGIGVLLLAGVGCGAPLPSRSQAAGHDGGTNTGGHGGGWQTGGHGGGSACAASGASCAASGCCQEIFETCIPEGSDRLCLNAIPPRADGGSCNGGASSNLPGVQLAFPDQPCAYTKAEVAAGIEIAYDEVITAAVANLRPTSNSGNCGRPDDAGLIVSYRISGAGQSYCLCDTGLCAPQTSVTTTTVGTHARQIPWDGRNWYGPSDTNNQEGAAFPPGTYTITLAASGAYDNADAGVHDGGTFSVTASRSITITP
jgi:hypothetical protein